MHFDDAEVKPKCYSGMGTLGAVSSQTTLHKDVNIWLYHGKSYIFNKLAFAKIMVHNTKPPNAVTETEVVVFPQICVSWVGFASHCRSATPGLSLMSFIFSGPLGSSGHILRVMAKAHQAASPTTWTLSKLISALQLLTSFNPKQNTRRSPSQESGTLIRGNTKL